MYILPDLSKFIYFALLLYGGFSSATLLYHRPVSSNTQLIASVQNNRYSPGRVIPGGTPFFWLELPTNQSLIFSGIDMTPTPCRIGARCDAEATVFFRTDLQAIYLDFTIEARYPGGASAQIVAAQENLCDWAKITQVWDEATHRSCPPRKGPATIRYGLELCRGLVTEGTYFIDLKLTSAGRTLTHLGAYMELKDLGGGRNSSGVAIN